MISMAYDENMWAKFVSFNGLLPVGTITWTITITRTNANLSLKVSIQWYSYKGNFTRNISVAYH